MELSKKVADRSRLARTALAVTLGAVAIRSLRRGRRLRGTLAGVGALAMGYDATAGSGGLAERIGIREPERGERRCAACGQPIRPGERRRPNENNEVVHEACIEAAD